MPLRLRLSDPTGSLGSAHRSASRCCHADQQWLVRARTRPRDGCRALASGEQPRRCEFSSVSYRRARWPGWTSTGSRSSPRASQTRASPARPARLLSFHTQPRHLGRLSQQALRRRPQPRRLPMNRVGLRRRREIRIRDSLFRRPSSGFPIARPLPVPQRHSSGRSTGTQSAAAAYAPAWPKAHGAAPGESPIVRLRLNHSPREVPRSRAAGRRDHASGP